MGQSLSLLLYLDFSRQLTVNVQFKVCQLLDSNRGPLESKLTAMPNEPQPQLESKTG